jgi:hypothetical protein
VSVLNCPACSCPLDDDEEQTYVRCALCGHISYNPLSEGDWWDEQEIDNDFDEDLAEWDDMPNIWALGVVMNITDEQLNELGEVADEIDNFVGATQLAMPPAFHLQQLQRALPELSAKIKALVVAIGGENPWQE